MIRIREAIVVEGRYDRHTLASVVDTVVVETKGFGIFNDRERLEFLRKLAARRGLLILTDSDGAGQVIRNFLKGAIPKEQLRHAFIPELYGKEKRKAHASKAGTLGVEGMSPEILMTALRRAGATIEGENVERAKQLTGADLFAAGLSGTPNAAARRELLCRKLGLPHNMTNKALMDAVGSLYTREEFDAAVESLNVCEN